MKHILSFDEIQLACTQYVVRKHYPELARKDGQKYTCEVSTSIALADGQVDFTKVTITVSDVQPEDGSSPRDVNTK